MVLTPRDKLLFRQLSNYGMLSTKQVTHLIFNDIATTTVLRRLRNLEDLNYVKRIQGPETQEVLWIITEKAAQIEGGELFKRYWNKNLLGHDFKLLRLRLELEKSGVAKSWVPEHEIRFLVFKKYTHKEAQRKLIPDGIMIAETSNKNV